MDPTRHGQPQDAPAPRSRGLRRHLSRFVLALLFVGVLPYLAFDVVELSPVADYPLAFVLAVWGVTLLAWGVARARRKAGGALAFNVGFLFLGLAVVEIWLGQSTGLAKHMVHAPAREAYVADHPDLGYVPLPGRSHRFAAVAEGEPVYDVVYGIGADGLRVKPPLADPPPDGSILCFGCSFTFGSGLEDDEAYPYQLEEALDGRLRCFNFGFSGYGPHHMLANLESGRVERIVEFPPRHVVYLAIPDHARRVSGAAVHDRGGPRYVLEDDGSVRREGTFRDDRRSVWRKRLFQFLNHSHIGQAITRRASRGEGSVELMAAVIAASRDAVGTRWPDCTFLVVLWDDYPEASDAIEAALRARGIEVERVSAFLPAFAEDPNAYRLHRTDEHPSAEAAAALARHLAVRFGAAPDARDR